MQATVTEEFACGGLDTVIRHQGQSTVLGMLCHIEGVTGGEMEIPGRR